MFSLNLWVLAGLLCQWARRRSHGRREEIGCDADDEGEPDGWSLLQRRWTGIDHDHYHEEDENLVDHYYNGDFRNWSWSLSWIRWAGIGDLGCEDDAAKQFLSQTEHFVCHQGMFLRFWMVFQKNVKVVETHWLRIFIWHFHLILQAGW